MKKLSLNADDENAKKPTVQDEVEAKIALSKRIISRKRSAHRLHTLSKQVDNQQRILEDVLQDMAALNADTKRIEQILVVLKKVEIVLAQESAKL